MKRLKLIDRVYKLLYSGHIEDVHKIFDKWHYSISEIERIRIFKGELFFDLDFKLVSSDIVPIQWIKNFKKIRIKNLYLKGIDIKYRKSLNEFEQFLFDNYKVNENLKEFNIYKILKDDFIEFLLETPINDDFRHGVILPNGQLFVCDYMGHDNLYYKLKLIELVYADNCWDDKTIFKFSSNTLNGSLIFNMEHFIKYNDSSSLPTQEQLNVIMTYPHKFQNLYSSSKNFINLIREYTIKIYNKGTKFGNLMFLKHYYKVNLPKISIVQDKLNFKNSFIRTSPDKSLAGLLNSKKVNKENFLITIENMKSDFENKNFIKKNQFHCFEQEFINGQYVGVASLIKNQLSYGLSNKENDTVNGILKNINVATKLIKEIETICVKLNKDLGNDIQIEFVIKGNKVYIVQLRILENMYDKVYNKEYSEFILKGNTFSKGNGLVDVIKRDEILIVKNGCESDKLTDDIKLVLIENDVSFSHLLILTTIKKIKSIYNTGFIESLPDLIKVDCNGKFGYLLNI